MKNQNEKSTIQTKIDDFSMNSPEIQNHTGISNQGLTCYLNSLIQVLFHLKKFREFIYNGNSTINLNNVKFCLQLLFRDLQNHKNRCSTKLLTTALGNDIFDTQISQDVFEFYTFFMKFFPGTPSSLFEGEYQTHISNDNSFSQIIKKPFNSLVLTVENCESIMDSFQLFTSPFISPEETFDNSICQNVFIKLPPVLSIVLKRFRINPAGQKYEKLNSIVIFPEKLDLSTIAPKCTNTQYEVFAIIAHIGTMDRGHYIAFINPDLNGVWFEFNDRKVREIPKEIVYNLSYGVDMMSAYMIFYVNEDSKHDLFENAITKIPDFVSDFVVPKVEKPPIQFFMNTEEGIAKNIQNFKSEYLNFDCRKVFPFPSGSKYKTAYTQLSKQFNKKSFRIWTVKYNSLEKVIDPDDRVKKDDTKSWLIQDIKSNEPLEIEKNHIVVFLSFFIPNSPTKLFYLGSHTFHIDQLISDIYHVIFNEYLHKPIEMKLFLFSNHVVKPLNDSISFYRSSLYNGVFIIVQEKNDRTLCIEDFKLNYLITDDNNITPNTKIIDRTIHHDLFSADSYITYILNRVTFNVYKDKIKSKLLFKLLTNNEIQPNQILLFLSSEVCPEFHPEKDTILFFDINDPDTFITETKMNIMLQRGNHEYDLYFLIYKGVSSIDESNMLNLELIINKKTFKFTINRNEPIKLIKRNLIDNEILPIHKNYRFYLTHNSRITSILSDDDLIPNNSVHVDEIPEYQLEEQIVIVRVAQCVKNGDHLTFFGNPFFIGITFDEICMQVIERICSITGCSADNLSILIELDSSKENYRKLLESDNVLDALDGKNEIFAFFS